MERRKTWTELTKDQQEQYSREFVDLESGETMADWWETYMDAIAEDGSWKTEGWPGN